MISWRGKSKNRDPENQSKEIERTGQEVDEPSNSTPPAELVDQPESLAEDLIARVQKAVEDWKHENNLASLPNHIVLQQVISILQAKQDLDRRHRREI